jgi:hypothetical protein
MTRKEIGLYSYCSENNQFNAEIDEKPKITLLWKYPQLFNDKAGGTYIHT